MTAFGPLRLGSRILRAHCVDPVLGVTGLIVEDQPICAQELGSFISGVIESAERTAYAPGRAHKITPFQPSNSCRHPQSGHRTRSQARDDVARATHVLSQDSVGIAAPPLEVIDEEVLHPVLLHCAQPRKQVKRQKDTERAVESASANRVPKRTCALQCCGHAQLWSGRATSRGQQPATAVDRRWRLCGTLASKRWGIYTTNAIESLLASLRKIIKTRGHFASDDAATKLIWLAMRNTMAIAPPSFANGGSP